MEKWTSRQMPDLNGKRALVTGANGGLGFEICRELARKGALVVMTSRSPGRGEEARKQILREQPEAMLDLMQLDLASLSSLKSFTAEFAAKFDSLDLLVNNAGVMAIPLMRTSEGFEMQFGVNHLGHFALTALLWPLLKKCPESRIVHVSSLAHRWGSIRFGDLHWEEKYNKWAAYGMSKLANLLFSRELARRIKEGGLGQLSLSAHPGYAHTGLQMKSAAMSSSRGMTGLFDLGSRLVAQDAWMGAQPVLYAAASSRVIPGGYYGPSGWMKLKGWPVEEVPGPNARNDIISRQLWEESERLTGICFPI